MMLKTLGKGGVCWPNSGVVWSHLDEFPALPPLQVKINYFVVVRDGANNRATMSPSSEGLEEKNRVWREGQEN